MYIKEIILDGFKSYQRRTHIKSKCRKNIHTHIYYLFRLGHIVQLHHRLERIWEVKYPRCDLLRARPFHIERHQSRKSLRADLQERHSRSDQSLGDPRVGQHGQV